MSENILVVDDEYLIRWSLEQNLKKEGYLVTTAETGEQALEIVEQELPDLILLDIQLPGINGIEVLQKVKVIDQDLEVIMITAYGIVETAVKAMKLGAYDYLNKPFNLDEVKLTIAKALETNRLKKEVARFRQQQLKTVGYDNIIGQDKKMKQLFEMVKKISASKATTVLLQGESGTGKDLIAKTIHFSSLRAEKPFMDINCAALPENLLESELVGHEKGAFTDAKSFKKGLFELADGGTILLDEIGEMRLDLQAKLLRIIENKKFRRVGGVKDIQVDVRIIAASNKNLEEARKDGSFREDLYYRLKVIPITIPPLRERKGDVILLAKYFIDGFNRDFKKNVQGISKEAEKLLLEYDWPGNVRELKNVIERALILESEDIVLPEHLPLEIISCQSATSHKANHKKTNLPALEIPPEGISIEMVEKGLIERALEITNHNQTHAAKLLDITRDALRYRMKKFGFL